MENRLKQQRGWYMYDWAVSAFTTSVITVFIGPYLTTIADNAAIDGYLSILGMEIFAGSFFSYCVSLSVILQVVFLPWLGALADYSNRKKQLLGIFAYIGAFAAMGLYFLEGTNYLLGGLLLIISNLSFGASMIFYNAFLNEIAEPDERDRVSSNGFAVGYVGGGLLLAINLVLVMQAEKFGLTIGMAVRISMASAGLWWAVFTIIPMLRLKSFRPLRSIPSGENTFIFGFKQIKSTIKDSLKYPKTLLFIVAYIFYNDGVQAVIVVASQFGQEALNLDIGTLTTVILMVQFVAFGGAKFFDYLASKINTKNALLISIVIWIIAVSYAYLFLNSEAGFYGLGAVIGLVLGGTQALSRSLYSHLIPSGKESEYFSLYEISERGTSWIGPLLFGISLQFTGSYRFAILSLGILFVVGFILLMKINFRQAIIEVGNTLPKNI
ncbi:MAG: MFS transporter [Candidatus Kapabacteria bacterium]|nr:MFS transporter [Ignavibacteriota bacterium]MCW5884441.1 MFS transporter [Candidatus Kapabacteria bacterium]